jgi:GxxExxY protein
MNDPISKSVIGAAFEVHNALGFGFLESVYEKSLAIELNERKVNFKTQSSITVNYHGQVAGEFIADFLVENLLIVELKAVTQLTKQHEVQLVNYLTATGIDDGLLINFGPQKVEIKHKYRTPK